MLENYITTSDLQNLYPLLYGNVVAANIDFTKYIERGFQKLSNDLYNNGVDLKLLMPRLDLLRASTADSEDPITTSTITATYTGDTFDGGNETRLVVYSSACTGTWTVKIQGSNQTTPTTWEDVPGATLSITSTGTSSIGFLRQYVHYRVVASGGTSLTFNCYLVERTFDDLIAYAVWYYVFTDMANSKDSVWIFRREDCEKLYVNLIASQKFTTDDGDYLADSNDSQERVQVRFSR